MTRGCHKITPVPAFSVRAAQVRAADSTNIIYNVLSHGKSEIRSRKSVLSSVLCHLSSIAQLQMPGTSHRPHQHPVSLFVINEFFSFGVPFEFAAQPYGNIIQVADGVGANGGFDGANRFLSGLNAIYEITAMIVTSRQANLIGTNS